MGREDSAEREREWVDHEKQREKAGVESELAETQTQLTRLMQAASGEKSNTNTRVVNFGASATSTALPQIEQSPNKELVPSGGEPTELGIKERMQDKWNHDEIDRAGEGEGSKDIKSESSASGIELKSPGELKRVCDGAAKEKRESTSLEARPQLKRTIDMQEAQRRFHYELEQGENRTTKSRVLPATSEKSTPELLSSSGEPTEPWIKERMQDKWDLDEIRKAGEGHKAGEATQDIKSQTSGTTFSGIEMKSPAETKRCIEEARRRDEQTAAEERPGSSGTEKGEEIQRWLQETP